ncbi:hypothetical protein JX265_013476 [Neoarthrinium moseri]|uniref:Uncharacterized protein n=1 Tax=Neoarthrinium moseri TaxID=1658444 RepID=A0A9P9W8N9_9PEZI|nr:uncharacterized protein JN550_007607 [Neoarthrinium moseri]KAI1841376.1 hypothetical protein JX266_012457 [Neoarthrinium moseri]KAI1850197.1 hypothetical protein JX265_013476 [Neoarthrinium moseri]KAI1866754.1 hypothetical protein JN550_007607 [Neoarthrinium moseri]
MDFIRANILRRGNSSDGQEADIEQQRTTESRGEQGQGRTRRLILGRPQIPLLFSGRQNAGRTPESRPTLQGEDESPKTPRFHLGLPSLPSTRLHLPNLSRTWTRDTSGPASPRDTTTESSAAEPRPSLQRSRTQRFPVVSEPQPIHPRSNSSSSRRQFRGADPAEMHLADLADTGRRRRHGNNSRSTRHAEKPKRFMFCFPWIKSRRIRSQILRCFVSGMFLILMLAVYLALSITKNINNSEFTILLILIILFTTIFFCHGLIRLCMLIVRPQSSEQDERARLPEMFGPGGYAVPRRPIRVVLARDEEAAGLESETTKLQPPAYGLWRESVRVDPNRIYWQRNEQQASSPEEEPADQPRTANRPPSYASDDGVEYVVEARPRSMAPLTDVPLPTHPSEIGRIEQRPSF